MITALPFAFLVGLMRSSLSRAGAVSALFERLGGVSARDALAEARAIGRSRSPTGCPDPNATSTPAATRSICPRPAGAGR